MSVIEVNPELISKATRSFRLCRKGKSGFKKDGTGENGIPPEYLSSGKFMFLEPISRLYLGDGNGFMPTQYVIGAPTIYRNDYYLDSKGELVLERNISKATAEAKGYESKLGLINLGYNLEAEYRRSMETPICFDGGILNLPSDDPMLLKFVMEHEQNTAAPRADKNKDPKRLRLFNFEPLLKEKDAAKSKPVENFDASFEAMKLVDALREKKGNGTYAYNETKLDAYLAILDEGQHINPGEVVQKFQVVTNFMLKNGPAFLEVITSATNDYLVAVASAEELGVLTVGAEDVKLNGGEKPKSIFALSNPASKTELIEGFILHLISARDGKLNFNEILRLTEKAKIEAASGAKSKKK